MLYAFGVGEIAVSLSGDPADRTRIVHTVRAVGAVSSAIVAMDARAIMGIRGPYGTPWPVDEARGRDVVFVAGGLGLAPLRPAIYHVLTHRDLYGKVAILVGMRNPAEILYRPLLEQWRARLDVALEVTVDRSDPTWHGHVGVVPSLVSRVDFDAANAIAMVCGPEIMMRFTVNALSDAGMPPERVYLSMERNMKCAIGLCGHCQFGPSFVCKDGPVMSVRRIGSLLAVREV
ncbi:MAG TPA: FAD/NAD(P)-binding protein [Steroidobacteraceae bacterium]|nr:FAD/NAD(P)-binding protein [Steroidobacteraceae bacterium]